jgi:hypothetical protein
MSRDIVISEKSCDADDLIGMRELPDLTMKARSPLACRGRRSRFSYLLGQREFIRISLVSGH